MTRRCIAIAWAALVCLSSAPVSAQATGGIVFVGSSIIHRWTNLADQMAPLPVLNRGFDGAVTSDMLRVLDSLVVPLRPRVIVYYCGSNDVDVGEPASAIAERIQLFLTRAPAALPDVRIVFLSVIKAPEKRDRWKVVDEVNRLIQAAVSDRNRLEYLDVNSALVDRRGAPRMDLYMADQLHLRPAAYEAVARIVKPVVTKALERP
jgi:lysophospholipase L1-like esterase